MPKPSQPNIREKILGLKIRISIDVTKVSKIKWNAEKLGVP